MKLFLSALSLAPVVTASGLSAVPSDVQQGFFPGRSGDVLFRPQHDKAADLGVVFINKGGVVDTNAASTMSLYSMADLTARALGVVPVNADVPAVLMHGGLLAPKPMAAVVFNVESLGTDMLSNPSYSMPNLESMSADTLHLAGASYPPSGVTLSSSLATGRTPSVHGIVARQWQTPQGVKKHAFSDWSSGLRVANLADIMLQSFEGESLVVSASADPQLAAAHSVNPSLLVSHPSWSAVSASWSSLSRPGFQSTHATLPRSLEADSLTRALRGHSGTSVLAVLAAQGLAIELSGETVSLQWTTAEGVEKTATYNLSDPADLMLFSELQFTHSLIAALRSDPALTSQVLDQAPDLYVLSFASLTALITTHGRQSPKVAGALLLLDTALPMFTSGFSSLYSSAMMSHTVLLGSHASLRASPDVRPVQQEIQRLLPEQTLELFPALHLGEEETSQTSLSHLCQVLQLQCEEEATGFTLFCPEASLGVASARAVSFFEVPAVYGNDANDTNATAISPEQVARVNVVIWISILMFLAVLWAAYAIANMEFKKDTLIYSTFNPKWETTAASGRKNR